jgi:hypothetical protein
MHIIPHNLLSDECMWAHPRCTHIPQGQEHVPQDDAHEGCFDEFVSGLGHRLPVNYGCWIDVFVWCIYLFIYFVQNSYSKDVTFVSVPWAIICVRLDPSILGDYFYARVLVPLEPGCDNVQNNKYNNQKLAVS